MKSHIFNNLGLILISLHLCTASVAMAHGKHPPKPTEEQSKSIPAAIEGSEEFARRLAENGRGLLNQKQLEMLYESIEYFNFASAIRQGRFPQSDPVDADYNRYLAEKRLCELAANFDDILVYDFTDMSKLPDPHAPISFDPHAGQTIIKTATGSKVKRFVCQNFAMDEERYRLKREIPVENNGTVFILQQLDQPSSGRSSTHIAFRKTGEANPFYWSALTFNVDLPGQLAIEIVDQEGSICPALVRLQALPGGKVWAPAEALDFRPMINDVTGPAIANIPGLNIYGPGRGLMVRMPGEFSGCFWVVDKPFEMALPAGKWSITVYRGLETIPITKTFEVESEQWTRKKITLTRWADMTKLGWHSGDDHVHARLLSSEDANKLMAFTKAMDIHVSNILEMGDPLRTYFHQRGFGKDFFVQDGEYWLVPGQEDPRSILGHNIAMNTRSMVRDLDKYLMLDWIADMVHQQGGLFGQTHVGQNVCEAHRGMALMAPRQIYDFYSIMQGGLGTELYYNFLDLGYKLTASAGSDMPYGGTLGNVQLYAYTGKDKSFKPQDWFDAIKAGNTFVTNGPMLEFKIDGMIAGQELATEEGKEVTIKARSWGLEGYSAPVKLEIVKLSKVIKSAVPRNGETELNLSFALDADESCWIAARAYGKNGSAAHTTPVYITKPGQRHWNRERVEEIIEKQFKILDEIEGVIKTAEKSKEAGTLLNIDYWGKRSVEQADAVRERIKITREIYNKLLKELKEQED
ncbi:MAG: CehA/McbA family metallohydrolase [Sedimentisphaeraceae bacterium JB056]